MGGRFNQHGGEGDVSYLTRYRDPLLPDDAIDVKLIPSISDFLGREDSDWPSLSVSIELAPWYWRVGWYSAPVHGHFLLLYLGPLRLNLWTTTRRAGAS